MKHYVNHYLLEMLHQLFVLLLLPEQRRLAGILVAIDISDIIHFFDHEKSSSISQLIKNKSKNLQKITQIF